MDAADGFLWPFALPTWPMDPTGAIRAAILDRFEPINMHGSVGIRHADAGWTAALLTSRHCQVSRSQPTKFFISHQQTTRHDGLEKPLVPIAGVLPIHRRVFGSYSRALNASAIRWEQAEVSSFHRLRCNRLRQTRIARPLGESSNIRCRTTGCKRRTHVCQT